MKSESRWSKIKQLLHTVGSNFRALISACGLMALSVSLSLSLSPPSAFPRQDSAPKWLGRSGSSSPSLSCDKHGIHSLVGFLMCYIYIVAMLDLHLLFISYQ